MLSYASRYKYPLDLAEVFPSDPEAEEKDKIKEAIVKSIFQVSVEAEEEAMRRRMMMDQHVGVKTDGGISVFGGLPPGLTLSMPSTALHPPLPCLSGAVEASHQSSSIALGVRLPGAALCDAPAREEKKGGGCRGGGDMELLYEPHG